MARCEQLQLVPASAEPSIVFREAPIPLLELRPDGELRVVDEFLAMDRPSTTRVGLASLPNGFRGHFQCDLSVEATVPPASLVLLEGADVVAEEARVLRSRMRDQGLRLGQLQPELVVQELANPSLDRLGLLPWPDEPQQEVVGIAHVPQAPEIRVVQHHRRGSLHLLAQASGLLGVGMSVLLDALP